MSPGRRDGAPPKGETMSENHVRIFDTTLRDGEQSPGATMTSAEKLEVAKALSRLGVDVIEAGFPAASPDDLAAVQRIAETVGRDVPEGRPERPGGAEPPIICGLARATEKDIDQAFAGVRGAKHPRIHTFLATSPIHREHKLRMTKEQVVERASKMVAYARALCADVEFSPSGGDHVVSGRRAHLDEVVAELPVGAGDENSHVRRRA